MPLANSGSPGYPHFSLLDYKARGSHTNLLRFDNLLEHLAINIRGIFIHIYWFIINNIIKDKMNILMNRYIV